MKKIILAGGISVFIFFALLAMPVLAAKNEKCATIQSGSIKDSAGQTVGLGYDQWGYNYQAHMFNGWYGNYSRPSEPVTEGDRLMMKWNDAWLSNKDCNADNNLDRHYGLDSYIGSGAWLTNHASGTYEGTWNVVGTWKWLVLGTYEHDLVITSQNSDGTFTATGGYPAGSYPYTAPGQTPEVITNGKVEGDTITFTTTYSGPYNPGYSVTVTGKISPEGTITGTGPWAWVSTEGKAVKNICSWRDFVKVVAVPADDAYQKPAATECPGTYGLDEQEWYSADGKKIGCSIWGSFAVIQEVSEDPCGMKSDIRDYRGELRMGLGNW